MKIILLIIIFELSLEDCQNFEKYGSYILNKTSNCLYLDGVGFFNFFEEDLVNFEISYYWPFYENNFAIEYCDSIICFDSDYKTKYPKSHSTSKTKYEIVDEQKYYYQIYKFKIERPTWNLYIKSNKADITTLYVKHIKKFALSAFGIFLIILFSIIGLSILIALICLFIRYKKRNSRRAESQNLIMEA